MSDALVDVCLVAAFLCGQVLLGRGGRVVRLPLLTGATVLVVGIPGLLQVTVAPGLLPALERDRTAIAHGQVWRLATSLLVQDGRVGGLVFNVVVLAVVGTLAELLWGRWRWAALALAAGVGAQLWGLLVQPVGGGNSVLNLGLAAGIGVLALRRLRGLVRLLGLVPGVAGLGLVALGDVHGGAVLIATAVASVLPRPDPAAGRAPAER